MGFEPEYRPSAPAAALRKVLPPDRVWLAMMQRAGAYPFANNEEKPGGVLSGDGAPVDRYVTFDKQGSFSLRYARLRRYGDYREALPDGGEFDAQFPRKGR